MNVLGKRHVAGSGLGMLVFVLAGCPAVAQVSSGTAFVGGTVITMADAGVLRNHTVLVRGDTILAVGPTGSLSIPSGYERIDASGKFLLPGLVDMHVHLSGSTTSFMTPPVRTGSGSAWHKYVQTCPCSMTSSSE